MLRRTVDLPHHSRSGSGTFVVYGTSELVFVVFHHSYMGDVLGASKISLITKLLLLLPSRRRYGESSSNAKAPRLTHENLG